MQFHFIHPHQVTSPHPVVQCTPNQLITRSPKLVQQPPRPKPAPPASRAVMHRAMKQQDQPQKMTNKQVNHLFAGWGPGWDRAEQIFGCCTTPPSPRRIPTELNRRSSCQIGDHFCCWCNKMAFIAPVRCLAWLRPRLPKCFGASAISTLAAVPHYC